MRNFHGFTLLELLIAMAISAIIAASSAIFIKMIVDSEGHLTRYNQRVAGVQKAMLVIEQDLSQIASRLYRDEYGEFEPAYFKVEKMNKTVMTFTRTGWRNPLKLPRSELQTVQYEFKENKLVRYYWTVLDRAQDSKPVEQVLLENVENFSIRLLNGNTWQNQWNYDDVSTFNEFSKRLPLQVEIILKISPLGEIKRDFSLVDF